MIFTAKFIVEIIGLILFIVVFIIMCIAINSLRKLNERVDILINAQANQIQQKEVKNND